MTKKLDKKTLEEPDMLTLFFAKMRTFIETHRKKIYLGSGIFILIFVLAAGFYLYSMNFEKNATTFYNNVSNESAKLKSDQGGEATIKGLKDLIAKYPRSNAALLGRYRLANLYYKNGQNDAAMSFYLEFIKHSPSQSDLVVLAYNSLGSLEEQKKNMKKALEYYEMAMKTKSSSSFEAVNYRNIARIYEVMNNKVKAAEFYKKALAETTDPVMTLLLKRKLAGL
jgi:predicted negative regulator of RcsB-dependent stress response